MLLSGAIEARAKVGLKMNVPEKPGRSVRFLPPKRARPSAGCPTAWVAVEVILEEKQERELIPRLKRGQRESSPIR